MTMIQFHDTVGSLVTERPTRARVFEELGIDFCCQGRRTLEQACVDAQLEPATAIGALEEHDRRVPASDEPRFAGMGMAELADHIEEVHHGYLRSELPRIAEWTEKLARVHGGRHPWLHELRDTFASMRTELDVHMFKEERILFPMVRELEGSMDAPVFHRGSVRNPISVMEHEHDDTGAALARMRELSSGFTPPADACNTFRATMAALEELERDLHVHIHKENSILFPEAAAREAELRAVPVG